MITGIQSQWVYQDSQPPVPSVLKGSKIFEILQVEFSQVLKWIRDNISFSLAYFSHVKLVLNASLKYFKNVSTCFKMI